MKKGKILRFNKLRKGQARIKRQGLEIIDVVVNYKNRQENYAIIRLIIEIDKNSVIREDWCIQQIIKEIENN